MSILGRRTPWAIIAIGLFNSIMFPTIFSLSVEGLGKQTSLGSGLLISMILGGALIPLAVGATADASNLQVALATTIVCYLYIVYFGLKGYRLGRKPG